MEQKPQILSNLLVAPQQHLILIIDDTGREKMAQRILRQFLAEQGQDDKTLKILQSNERLKQPDTLAGFLDDCSKIGKKERPLNVVLPTLADLLCYLSPTVIFEFLHQLRYCGSLQRVFLWASPQHLIFPKLEYLVAAFQYLCDTQLHFIDEKNLRFTSRKPGGGVTYKTFTYKVDKNEFQIQTSGGAGDQKNPQQQQQPQSLNASTNQTTQPNIDASSTFKIELEEDEVIARNAMKLPYEKTSETDASGGGNIVYTPDASDDFDDEDPDEDLCI